MISLPVRGLILAELLHRGDEWELARYCAWDRTFCETARKYRFFHHQYAIPVSCLLIIFSLQLEYVLFIRQNLKLLSLNHELIITNGHRFFELNFPLLRMINLRRPVHSLVKILRTMGRIWNNEDSWVRFGAKQFGVYNNQICIEFRQIISKRVRARLMVLSTVMDVSFSLQHSILCKWLVTLFMSSEPLMPPSSESALVI